MEDCVCGAAGRGECRYDVEKKSRCPELVQTAVLCSISTKLVLVVFQKLSQYVMKDTAVQVIFDFDG